MVPFSHIPKTEGERSTVPLDHCLAVPYPQAGRDGGQIKSLCGAPLPLPASLTRGMIDLAEQEEYWRAWEWPTVKPYSKRILAALVLIIAGLVCSACLPLLPADREAVPYGSPALVTYVIDGDTINVTIEGRPYIVRYIGIDTPEMDSLAGEVAREANRRLVEAGIVYLERDVSETDRYGRLLRYVYLPDGTFVNAELVRLGYALAKAYPPDTRHQAELNLRQTEARRAVRGLWQAPPAEWER